jgi:hypothetical protein
MAGAACLVLCLVLISSAVGGAAATPGGDVHYFEARAVSSGSTTADYGEDRKQPGQITASGVDGKESLEWRWEVRAVASSTGAGPLVTRARTGRARNVLTVSIVSYGIQMGILGEERLCEQDAGTTTYLSNDGEGAAPRKSGLGDFVHDAGFSLYGGELGASPPRGLAPHACVHSATGDGGLKFVEGAGGDAAPVPRGAFNPRSDRSFERTYRSSVDLDRSHYGDPNAAHTFVGQTQLEVEIDAISERRFDKLVRKYQHIPINVPEPSESEYHEPPG